MNDLTASRPAIWPMIRPIAGPLLGLLLVLALFWFLEPDAFLSARNLRTVSVQTVIVPKLRWSLKNRRHKAVPWLSPMSKRIRACGVGVGDHAAVMPSVDQRLSTLPSAPTRDQKMNLPLLFTL